MNDVHKIVDIRITIESSEPRTGVLQVDAGHTVIKFEITEELAHVICTDLERFLTR